MTNKYSPKIKKGKMRRIKTLVKTVMKSYSISTYASLMKLELFQEAVLLLSQSGMVRTIIEAYPRLQESKKAYEDFSKSITAPYLKPH